MWPYTEPFADAPVQSTAEGLKLAESDDPEEVDISQHFYQPGSTPASRRTAAQAPIDAPMTDAQLRQMMLGFPPPASATPSPGPQANPFASGFPGMPGMEGAPPADDPMVQMLQQMMGGAGGMPNLESMMSGGSMPSFPGMPNLSPNPAEEDSKAYIWRIVHAVFALGLGIYIALTQTTFTGTQLAREKSGLLSSAATRIHNENEFSQFGGSEYSSVRLHFFWIFATFEVVLQSTRFFLEKGRMAPQPGMLGMAMSFLPEPYRTYMNTALRYMRIWTTISGDAMVVVFVLGVIAYWKGL